MNERPVAMVLAEDYFKMQDHYFDQMVVTAKSKHYRIKRADELCKAGWKLKSQHIHPDGGVTMTFVR